MGVLPMRKRCLLFTITFAFLGFFASTSFCDPEFLVNTYTDEDQSLSSVAIDPDGNFIVAWVSDGQDGDEGGILAQRFDDEANTVGDEFQVNTVTDENQSSPSIAMNPIGNFIKIISSIS